MIRTAMGWILAGALMVAGATVEAATCQIGVKGGVAIQTLGGDDIEGDDLESRTGFAGGAYFGADFNRNFGLRFEALYYMKGATADSADFELSFKLDYIEVPALLVVHFPFSETGRVDVFGGPTLGINVGHEVEFSYSGLSLSGDLGDDVEDFEFGLTLGAGMSFEAGSAVIGLDGRYGFGLTDVFDFSEDDINASNRGFAFMASVGVPIGEK